MEGLEACRPVVIYGKTANWSEVARLMLQARGGEADSPHREYVLLIWSPKTGVGDGGGRFEADSCG